MSAIMSQNGRKMAKIMHSAAKKFDWNKDLTILRNFTMLKYLMIFRYLKRLGNLRVLRSFIIL